MLIQVDIRIIDVTAIKLAFGINGGIGDSICVGIDIRIKLPDPLKVDFPC